jgi:hypothetical protein
MPAGEVRQLGPGRIITAPDPIATALDHLYAYAHDLDEAGQTLNAGTIRTADKRARAQHDLNVLTLANCESYWSRGLDAPASVRTSARLALHSDPTDLAAALTLSDSAQL